MKRNTACSPKQLYQGQEMWLSEPKTTLDLPLLLLCQVSPQPFPGSCSAEARQDRSWWVYQGCWFLEARGSFAGQWPDREVSLSRLHWYRCWGWNTARESLVKAEWQVEISGGVRTANTRMQTCTHRALMHEGHQTEDAVLRHRQTGHTGPDRQVPRNIASH